MDPGLPDRAGGGFDRITPGAPVGPIAGSRNRSGRNGGHLAAGVCRRAGSRRGTVGGKRRDGARRRPARTAAYRQSRVIAGRSAQALGGSSQTTEATWSGGASRREESKRATGLAALETGRG